MLKLNLMARENRPLRILCLGAHSDDIEIGCGGTILKLLSQPHPVEVSWVVLGSLGIRGKEAISSARRFLESAKRKRISTKRFKDRYFPYLGREIKTYFEELQKTETPDIVFTHYRHDLHQDHRLVSELTWNAFRDHLILEYEIIKYDGDIGVPNLYAHLDEETCAKKVDIIMESFSSQRGKHWFTADALYSVLRIRGIESKAPGRYAEGFYCRKMIL